MSDLFDGTLQWFQGLGSMAYVAAVLVSFLESIIVLAYFLPGAVLLAFIGFLCYLKSYNFYGMLLAGFVGHFLGEFVNYELGRRKGRPFFQAHNRYLNLELLQNVEHRFHENALRLIFAGQFVGMLRPIVSFTAGMIHYPMSNFLPAFLVVDFLWALAHLGIGYLLGASWAKAAQYTGGFGLVLLAVVVAGSLLSWWMRRRKKRLKLHGG